MKRNFLFPVLKGLGCVFVLLYFYPFFFIANGFLSPRDGAAVSILETCALLLPGGVGMLMGSGMAKTKLSAVKKNLFKILLLLPLAAGFFFVYFAIRTVWPALVATLLSAIAYFVGYVLAFSPYGDIINDRRFLVLMGVYAGALLAVYLLRLPADIPSFVILFLLGTAIYLIQSNQSNIDYLMERRRHPLSQLPEKIRRYNLFLVGGIFAALLLLFLLKDWIILFFGWVGELLRRGVLFLFGLMKGNPFEEAPLEGSTAPQGGQQLAMPEGEANPVVQAILSVAAAALFLFLIIRYRQELAALFRNLYRRIRDAVSRLMHRDYARVRVDKSSEYYTDLEESLIPAEYRESQRRGSNAMRQWRKDYKRYANMENNAEKFRRGYALILEWLTLQKIPIRPSDTTLEILDKSAKIIPAQEFGPPTGVYNALRYGEREFPLEQLAQVDAVLASLRRKN